MQPQKLNELKQHILAGNSLSRSNAEPFIAYLESLENGLRKAYEAYNNPLNLLGAKQEIMTNFFRDTLPQLVKEVRDDTR